MTRRDPYYNLSLPERNFVHNEDPFKVTERAFGYTVGIPRSKMFGSLGKKFLKLRPQIKSELEVIVPMREVGASRLFPTSMALYIQSELLKDNPQLIPLGYYFTFDRGNGVDYYISIDDVKARLPSVKTIQIFFGLPFVPKGKKVKLDLPTSYRFKTHSLKRSSSAHSFNMRGGLLFAEQFKPTKSNNPQSEQSMSKDKVPLRMKATSRRKASKIYALPKKKAYPIGDLYHARKAINYLQWQWRKNGPGNSYLPEAKKVMKAVERNYRKYNWKAYWTAKRNKSKNKSKLPTYSRLMK